MYLPRSIIYKEGIAVKVGVDTVRTDLKKRKRKMSNSNIAPGSGGLSDVLTAAIDNKTKPIGALGLLESTAHKIGMIQNTTAPELTKPHLVVFAGDHGIAKDGVSAYPQEVTYQMVLNFLNGGAAINVFCAQHNINLSVVDAGVVGDFDAHDKLLQEKVAHGTRSYLSEKAMTLEQCEMALAKGKNIVARIIKEGTNVIGFGEMGIGNTSAASILMSIFCELDIADCVGRGTGVNDEQFDHKVSILASAIKYHQVEKQSPMEVLSTFAGFEMVMMAGAMLSAAENKALIMVDGFIATAAFLAAYEIDKNILDYAVFCHQSDEQGHGKMLKYLNAEPLLKMNLRLGEGTGCALAYPLIESAVRFLNDMASFESAGVSKE